MRSPYEQYESDPSPADPARFVWRPVIPVSIHGRTGRLSIKGVLDTGADETLLPFSITNEVGPDFVPGVVLLFKGAHGSEFATVYGTIDLSILLKRRRHRWRATVGFVRGRAEALLGHIGFLQDFTVTCNGPDRYSTLKPHGAFPPGIMPT